MIRHVERKAISADTKQYPAQPTLPRLHRLEQIRVLPAREVHAII
jgi:hypothetical protein